MKRVIRIILLIFFIIVFAVSFWKFHETLVGYREGRESYCSLEQYVLFPETDNNSEETDALVSSSAENSDNCTKPPDISAWPKVDFDELSKINPDVIGWIYIEGTNVNYPVVQGSDNNYYLKHLFDGTYNSSGCIFLDYRCAADFSDRNSIIYGHHIKNKSMFGGLVEYKKQTFYDEHSVALLVTPTAYYKIQFFSGYVSDNWGNAWDLALDDTDHAAWLSEIQEKSCFETEYTPASEDRIITLSTCTYEFDSAKFVLHGYISETIKKIIIE